MKKGVSPLLATVLLIIFVIVLAAIILIWARSFVKEQVEKIVGGKAVPAEVACKQISFDAKIGFGDETYLYATNYGDIPLNRIDLKIVRDKSIEVIEIAIGLEARGSKKIKLSKEISNKLSGSRVVFLPVLLGNVRGKTLRALHRCQEEFGKTQVF